MTSVFIDGSAGTTGLRIRERLAGRKEIEILSLPDHLRKDESARREMLNRADLVFLCLPDDAAREAVAMIDNEKTVVFDTSTAHRTNPAWTYGFPELTEGQTEKIRSSRRIAVPGCHASGMIALVAPLVRAGVLDADAKLVCTSVTGYSGGGKRMIADYEDSEAERSPLLGAPRQYALSQMHKHLPEMTLMTGLHKTPVFMPFVADFYSGMEVTVPLFAEDIHGSIDDIKEIYASAYQGPLVSYDAAAAESEGGFLSAGALTGLDTMKIHVAGNADRILTVARYDNLGKGASGAAIACMNIVLGLPIETGLAI